MGHVWFGELHTADSIVCYSLLLLFSIAEINTFEIVQVYHVHRQVNRHLQTHYTPIFVCIAIKTKLQSKFYTWVESIGFHRSLNIHDSFFNHLKRARTTDEEMHV